MRILISGATGFIGKALCEELLCQNHEIIGLTRSPREHKSNSSKLRYVKYELGNDLPNNVIEFEPEILYHLSWEGIPNFTETICIENLVDQTNFFIKVKQISTLKKIIGAGTCAEYGVDSGICSEQANSITTYFGWAKNSIRNFLEIFCKENCIKFIWLRIFYVYGPNQRSNSLIPYLLKMNYKNEHIQLNNPKSSHDFIYIDDVVAAFVKAILEWNLEGIYNVGTGKLTNVEKIDKILKKKIQSNNAELKNEELNEIYLNYFDKEEIGIFADVSKSRNELKWEAKVNIQDGLALSIDLYKKNE
jgi:nucleoside-diphosphate-sugar epimerase